MREVTFEHNYLPCNIWDILLLKHLFFCNANLPGHLMFYLAILLKGEGYKISK